MTQPAMTTDRWMILAAVLVATALSAIEQSVVFTAMPSIVGALGGMELYSWVFTAFMFAQTLLTPIYGKLADLYGRKRVLQVAIFLFILGSAASGLSGDMPQLIAFRALQGLGAGGILPVSLTIFGDLFNVEQRAKYTGLISMVWGISALLGPAVGSAILSTIGWRWVFAVNVPVGLVAMAMLAIYLRETTPERRPRLDWAGALLMMTAVGALLVALAQGGVYRPWTDPVVLGLLAVTALGLAALVWHERRAPEPLLPPDLFRSRIVTVSLAVSVFFGVILMAMGAFVPLLAQGVLGTSVFFTAVVVASLSIGWPAAAAISGRLILRLGYRRLTIAGQVLQFACPLGLVLLAPGSSLWWAVLWVVLTGAGFGFTSTASTIGTQNAVPWQRRGVATSTLTFVRNLGMTIGGAALGTLLSVRLAAGLETLPFAAPLETGAGRDTEAASALLDPARLALLAPDQVLQLRLILDGALDAVFVASMALGLLGLVFAFLMPPGLPRDLDYQVPADPVPAVSSPPPGPAALKG